MSGSSDLHRARGYDDFATTQWSVVLRAGRRDATGAAALADLCRTYWYPLYAYVRRRSPDAHSAQDQVQAFFAELLEHDKLAATTPERGKFRSFLLTALRHFLINAYERQAARKRGGGVATLSLDLEAGESRWSLEPVCDETPERIFEREWTLAVVAEVLERLKNEYAATGKAALFNALQPTLAGGAPEGLTFAEVAAGLGTSEDAARQAAHRLRRRYRELLRTEVSRTVADPAEVEEEIRGLFESLGR